MGNAKKAPNLLRCMFPIISFSTQSYVNNTIILCYVDRRAQNVEDILFNGIFELRSLELVQKLN